MHYRYATVEDAQAVHDIYGYYVEHTAVTFTTQNPDVDSYAEKISKSRYAFWIAEENGEVIGFAYADRIRPHDAYLWDVELTVYLRHGAAAHSGVGSGLYERLLADITQQGFRNAYGVITQSNEASLAFHRKFGFSEVARFENMGYKHGKWHGVIWMHKALGSFDGVPALPTPFA